MEPFGQSFMPGLTPSRVRLQAHPGCAALLLGLLAGLTEAAVPAECCSQAHSTNHLAACRGCDAPGCSPAVWGEPCDEAVHFTPWAALSWPQTLRQWLAAAQVHMHRIARYFFPARHVGDVSQRWQKLLRLPGSVRLQVLVSGWQQACYSACSILSCTFRFSTL